MIVEIDYSFVGRYLSMMRPKYRMNFLDRALAFATLKEKAIRKAIDSDVNCTLCRDSFIVRINYILPKQDGITEAKRAVCVCDGASQAGLNMADKVSLAKVIERTNRLFCPKCMKPFTVSGEVDLYSIPGRMPNTYDVVCPNCARDINEIAGEYADMIKVYLGHKDKIDSQKSISLEDSLLQKMLS